MGLVADVNRLVTATWAPTGPGGGYIASGTFAGAIDASFESGATIEVFGFDAARARLKTLGGARCTERFDSITWSRHAGPHQRGLIAGGLHDGTVCVWDAAHLIREPKISANVEHGVVFGGSKVPKKHTGPVPGLEFNPFRANLLASASADGQVLIWDLSNAANGAAARSPDGSVAGSPTGGGNKDSLTSLAWNCHLQHILATGSSSGIVVIWDLRKKRPVLSIRNPRGRLRSSSINWNPEAATQILTCTDDNNEERAGLLWDVRNTTQPIVEFTHHGSHGIVSSSWCPHDAEMILTSSKDSRTTVVSAKTGTVLAELPRSNQWNFNVKWSPKLPGVYLTTSFDGQMCVKSLLTSDVTPSVSAETANVLAESFGALGDMKSDLVVKSPGPGLDQGQKLSVAQAPKWLLRRCSISFGFGGRAAVFKASEPGKVMIHKPFGEKPSNTESLDRMLSEATIDNLSPLKEYCEEAASNSKSPEDEMAWEILSIQLTTDSRVKLLSYLGYEVPSSEGRNSIGIELSPPLADPVRAKAPQPSVENADEIPTIQHGLEGVSLDGPAPWDEGGSVLDPTGTEGIGGNSHEQNGLKDLLPDKTKSTSMTNGLDVKRLDASSIDKIIKKAVVVGDFETAINTCMQAGRTADALILAHAAGPDIWYRTQQEYLSSLGSGGVNGILKAIAGTADGVESFINGVAKDSWKDALAVIITYEKGPELVVKCNQLGKRLMENQQHAAALACFTCALNTNMMTRTWMRKGPSGKSISASYSQRIELLTQLVNKIRVCAVVTSLAKGEDHMGGYRVHDELSTKAMLEYAGILAAHGEVEAAGKYLQNLDGEVSSVYGTVEDMRGRIIECINGAPSATGQEFQSSNYTQSGGQEYPTSFGGPAVPRAYDAPPAWGQQQMAPPPTSSSNLYKSALSSSPMSYAAPPAPVVPSYVPPMPPARNFQTSEPPPTPPTTFGSKYSVSYSSPAPVTPPPPMPEPMPPVVPPPPMPAIPSPQDSTVGGGNGYGMPSQPMQYLPPSAAMAAPAMPPPPPPSTGNMPIPQSFRGKPGANMRLPPSAEVAVAESRARKPQSSSGMPGGRGHQRSTSSSSISSIGGDPNVTIEKVETSKIPADKQVIVRSLRGAYMYTAKLNNSPLYKRKMDDISKKVGKLLYQINVGALDAVIVDLLVDIGRVLEKGDYDAASKVVAKLTRDYWEGNGSWIQSLKRLFDSARVRR
eukprot:Plantae.Rhodophyta-Hildenbrandia_rubra.ctg10776.p1 GENE.Plantae.Rhodophyta-Hildenbrandia_rubra.ctg10776~~Plantae.Rhodophyta-Hildenbrandia_rubra.ctg10776.p1  ORF type:complete len:1215 (-),score=218.30 Plantae.Rhodophyta-Hildenbrandia_rubra.ctg10776:143-3787(-)